MEKADINLEKINIGEVEDKEIVDQHVGKHNNYLIVEIINGASPSMDLK
jgi:hypothetical protein